MLLSLSKLSTTVNAATSIKILEVIKLQFMTSDDRWYSVVFILYYQTFCTTVDKLQKILNSYGRNISG